MDNSIYEVERDDYVGFIGQLNKQMMDVEQFYEDKLTIMKIKSKVIYHPNYDEYVEMIVAHPNYKGLFYERRKDGMVKWVVTGKSAKGKERKKWLVFPQLPPHSLLKL